MKNLAVNQLLKPKVEIITAPQNHNLIEKRVSIKQFNKPRTYAKSNLLASQPKKGDPFIHHQSIERNRESIEKQSTQ